MRLAIPYDNDFVAKHFGKAQELKIYAIEEGKIIASQVIPTKDIAREVIGIFLHDLKIDAVVCQKIGRISKQSLDESGVQIYAGVMGVCDVRAEQFAKQTLKYDEEVEAEDEEEPKNKSPFINCSAEDCSTCGGC
ncbi:hypothetical protein P261_02810 [Lachnospiraceae bacterium TWA4]|nr:hypothetical protein P261_02810 [Lachnospiraceae bacterium TWA4]